ncbi:MAG: XrtA/PEP-CTERM system exopolysaccharide export protein [Pseudomonadota bacterium]
MGLVGSGTRVERVLKGLRLLCLGFAASIVALATPIDASQSAKAQSGAIDPNAKEYVLGPGDTIQIFVWRSAELTETLFVRPDGRITTRLLEDLQAAGRTPTELARDIETGLAEFVQTPIVTVIVTAVGQANQQNITVLGQATTPSQLPYFNGMTVLDVIVAVGGLTPLADGNGSILIRELEDATRSSIELRLDDLLSEGDLSADIDVRPGDTIIIPESWL